MIASRLPWVAAAAASVLVGIASILAPVGDPGASLLYEIAITTFTLVGALLITRVPGNKVGGLLLAAGLIMSIDDLAGLYAELGGAASPILARCRTRGGR